MFLITTSKACLNQSRQTTVDKRYSEFEQAEQVLSDKVSIMICVHKGLLSMQADDGHSLL